ncbi:MAG: TIGR04282 family arsenosugar biosynthesis glycosyltransferase [Thermodesulfobacteriota bacterium]
MPSAEALIVMGKAPMAGRVKTRLCPPLTPGDAAALCACMLEDTVSEMASLRGVRRYLFIDPPGAAGNLRAPPYDAFETFPQRGRNLGERMAHAAEIAFRRGAKAVTIVGADCPTLSAARVRLAFQELGRGAGVVLGPARDGGYYLVGLSGPDTRLFRGIGWGTPAVLSETAERLRAAGTPFAFLPPERDIDIPQDLAAFRAWAKTRRVPACPRTRSWVTSRFAAEAAPFAGAG